MFIYYAVIIFTFGLVLGSFYTAVGERLPEGKSIITPPSTCPICNHRLSWYELIPVLSYIFLSGKCKNCKHKIPVLSTIIELVTGVLFLISYLKFGISVNLFISLIFISILMIVIVSDIRYMIICDEILLIGNVLLVILIFLQGGLKATLLSLGYGIISFFSMFLIKFLGDIIFKRESMGGGDIKLMFSFGLVMGIINAIASIFLASFIGLPISLIMMKSNSSHEIPFGPYLSIAAIILFLSSINVIDLIIRV